MERVRHLLRHTDFSLKDIAAAAGFSSAQYMSMVFREDVGLSPSTYRGRRSGSESAGKGALQGGQRMPDQGVYQLSREHEQ